MLLVIVLDVFVVHRHFLAQLGGGENHIGDIAALQTHAGAPTGLVFEHETAAHKRRLHLPPHQVLAHLLLELGRAELPAVTQHLSVQLLAEETFLLKRLHALDLPDHVPGADTHPAIVGEAQHQLPQDQGVKEFPLERFFLLRRIRLDGAPLFVHETAKIVEEDLFAVHRGDSGVDVGVEVVVNAPQGEGNAKQQYDRGGQPPGETVADQLQHDRACSGGRIGKSGAAGLSAQAQDAPPGATAPGALAEWTGLEPATPGVTGRYSNQLNYHSWRHSQRKREACGC